MFHPGPLAVALLLNEKRAPVSTVVSPSGPALAPLLKWTLRRTRDVHPCWSSRSSVGVSSFDSTVWLVRKPLYRKGFLTGWPVHSDEDTPGTRSARANGVFRGTDVKQHGRRRQLRFLEQRATSIRTRVKQHAPRRGVDDRESAQREAPKDRPRHVSENHEHVAQRRRRPHRVLASLHTRHGDLCDLARRRRQRR
jgi:hypothetical protein